MATQVTLKEYYKAHNVQEIRDLKSRWGWIFALGLVLLILGILAIGLPWMASLVASTFIGLIFLFTGVVEGLQSFHMRRRSRILGHLLLALAYLIVGASVLSSPLTGVVALTFTVGVLFLLGGSMKSIVAIVERHEEPSWGFLFVSGIMSLVLGVLILAGWPGSAIWALGLLVGVDLVFLGMATIALSLAMKKVLSKA